MMTKTSNLPQSGLRIGDEIHVYSPIVSNQLRWIGEVLGHHKATEVYNISWVGQDATIMQNNSVDEVTKAILEEIFEHGKVEVKRHQAIKLNEELFDI